MANAKFGPANPKWIPRPLCKCGCGQPVRRHFDTWIHAHVPTSLRSLGGKRGRAAYAWKKRSARFRLEVERALDGRRTISREQLYELCNTIWRQAFTSGYSASESKHRRRQPRVAA